MKTKMANSDKIDQALLSGYEFTPGHYFSKGFEYFKERAGEFIGFTVIYMIISMMTSFIPVFGTIISLIISAPLSMGALIFTHRMKTEQDIEFSHFFDGFKKFTPLFATYILQIVIYIILALPLIFVVGTEMLINFAAGDMEAFTESSEILGENAGLIFGFTLVFIYIAISLRWSLHLAYFHDYSPVNAIKTSFLLVNKSWFSHFIFIVLCALAALVGVLALLVGLVVAIPVISIADYHGYASVTGLGNSMYGDNSGIQDDLV
jgi:hypothetical protein